MSDITFNGITMEFSVLESLMDAQLKQEVTAQLGSDSEQALLDAYITAHREKFGKDFPLG
jgi:hypothetical protein